MAAIGLMMHLRSCEVLSTSKKLESDSCTENHDMIVADSQLEAEQMPSSSGKEIAVIGIQSDMVECVTADVIQEKESALVSLNLFDSGLKVETNLSTFKVDTDSESTIDERDVVKVSKDNKDKKGPSLLLNSSLDANKKIKKKVTFVFGDIGNACDEKGESVLGLKSSKRGRKRKVLNSSECNGEVRAKGRVLRSNTVVMSEGVKVDDDKLNESVVGFKRKMEAECLDQTELEKVVGEKSQRVGRPKKKQKVRGRPPKIQGEGSLKVKIKVDSFNKVELENKGDESTSLIGRQQNKRKGRPPKLYSEEQGLQKNKHKNSVGHKRLGRPPKVQEGNVSTKSLTNSKKGNKWLKDKDVKESSKCNNLQIGRASKESCNNTSAEESVSIQKTKKMNKSSGKTERRKEQQLVRDQIVSMIVKAGWKIEYRKRLEREYMDAVYVDEGGKTHWSITKAYFSLKKKIEKKVASAKEIESFTLIPDDEMGVLFRAVSKVRSDKNQKKKFKAKKNSRKADIIIKGEVELNKHRKDTEKATRERKVTQKSRQGRKPRLVARSTSKKSDQNNDDCTLYSEKRNLLSWMIDSSVVTLGGKLQYGEGSNGVIEGEITRDGINCKCCNEIIDIASFVAHGEGSKFSEGIGNIYLESGSSLVRCLFESWKKEESSRVRLNHVNVDVEGEDPSDDTCNMCGDGGDLICCDGCPSTFHQSCLDIQSFPSGDWHCTYCSCKFCGLDADVASEMDDSDDEPTAEMLTCCLCEEKFHSFCLDEEDAVEDDSSSLLFCGTKCHEIHNELQAYVGVEFELEDGFSWSLLKRSDVSQVFALDDQQKIECNSKLAVAFSVMDECFEPILDERSGTNMIQNVVYSCGSNFRRLNYAGFYTAILERGGELISAASIRIHGHRLAEMPFIGTRNMYRRQGMCRRLLDAIENALSSVGVGELVIPAIPDLYETWTNVFGFKPLEESKRESMKCMSMILFPGTNMLWKPLLKNQIIKKYVSSEAVSDDETLGCTIVEEATHVESMKLIKPSSPTSKIVPKTTFDLNVQPGATDSDIQPIDDSSISRDSLVFKNSFKPSDSRTQSLVLV
ncbi:uncharacterized protein [Rutidosis leptorrhynchoides]|uniref:uncharacterized protein n=1 Tax=Rutidosis leptorrhynchoides TaxID=125765 RepID=UPI003A99D220